MDDDAAALQDLLKEAIAAVDFAQAQAAIDMGAGPNVRDEDGTTALTWAAFGSGGVRPAAVAERVRWLLARRARVSEERSRDGTTSVHHAAEAGNVAVLELLLAADGACALAAFDYVSRTPLICAVDGDHLEAARLLIDAGSDVDANEEAKAGNSALSWAVSRKNAAMVELLLDAGADPTLPGWMRRSALDRASQWREVARHPDHRRIYELLEHAARHPGRRRRR
jgi:ankyrin repeat protein